LVFHVDISWLLWHTDISCKKTARPNPCQNIFQVSLSFNLDLGIPQYLKTRKRKSCCGITLLVVARKLLSLRMKINNDFVQLSMRRQSLYPVECSDRNIQGCQVGNSEKNYSDAVSTGRWVTTFRKNTLPPVSGYYRVRREVPPKR
jgi:hypothetical protein